MICRPTVVVNTLEEPFPGWTDNLNGPVGLLVGGASGLLRTVYGKPAIDIDFIVVDKVVKALIAFTWHNAIIGDKTNPIIQHISKYGFVKLRQDYMIIAGKQICKDNPMEKKIWYPGFSMTTCWYNYYINVILFHVIPALFLDLMLRMFGNPPMFLKLQRKIYIANMAVSHFMFNEWTFSNLKMRQCSDHILKEETSDFYYLEYLSNAQIYEFYLNAADYVRVHFLKETKVITEKTRTRTKWMYFLDCAVKILFFGMIIWILFLKHNILGVFCSALSDYWKNL